MDVHYRAPNSLYGLNRAAHKLRFLSLEVTNETVPECDSPEFLDLLHNSEV